MNSVTKYPILGLNQDDDDVSLPVGFCREIHNLIPSNSGLSRAGGAQNVPGTILRSNGALPAGTNTCINAVEDKTNNRIFYFIHNSLSSHGIWYFTPSTNTHTLVLQSQHLGFTLSDKISSSVIEDILTWTDGREPKSIKVSDAVAGVYSSAGTYLGENILLSQINLYKPAPRFPPTAFRSTDVSHSVNSIGSDSWQFAIQYVFRDDTQSKYSPLSKIVGGDTFPDPNNLTGNTISVSYPSSSLEPDIAPVVKRIRFAYVKNNDGIYWPFKEVDMPGPLTASFKGNESISGPDETAASPVNFIPNKSKAIAIHNQRTILTSNEFDYADIGSSSISLSSVEFNDPNIRNHHLPGSAYTYGIIYFDRYGRTNGVVRKSSIVVPLSYGSLSSEVQFSISKTWIRWTITGAAPSWATTYAIVRKRNDTISSVCTTSALVMFYKREGDTAEVGEVADDGKVYFKSRQNGWDDSKHLSLKIATNNPISLDKTYRVRVLENIGQTRQSEPILDIRGDKLICRNFGITNWQSPAKPGYFLIRIEKSREEEDPFFYEIGQTFAVSNGVHSTTTGLAYGDMWLRQFDQAFTFDPIDTGTLDYSFSATSPGYPGATILSQSPVCAGSTLEESKTTIENVKAAAKNEAIDNLQEELGQRGDPLLRIAGGLTNVIRPRRPIQQTEVSTLRTSFTFDYNKIASDLGRPWVEVLNKRVNRQPNTLAISDKYVLNSQVNGINSFLNLYEISPERSPIRKLVSLGAGSVLLAIHERATTALASYSEDNILHTSNGSQILGNGKSIFGYDRQLSGNYGTVYPDSVVEHDGRVWWFDPYNGEVCRYAANGVTPIGTIYKMRTFFRAKGLQFQDVTNRNVIGGYDSNLQMYFLTFRSANASEEVTVAFLDKPGEERWFSFYSFKPDRYININDRFFAFVNGQLWEHNVSGNHNAFYGEQNQSSFRAIFNSDYSQPKILRNISTESTHKWSFSMIRVHKLTGTNQETVLTSDKFVKKDDVFYADVMRDRNTFGLTPGQGLIRGSILVGKTYEVSAENPETAKSTLNFVNFGYDLAPGHHAV